MRAVIQRVLSAGVTIDNELKASIKKGYLVLLGIEEADITEDSDWLCRKIVAMRIFSDENGLMNLDLTSVNGEVLVVSQFTLHASYKKGNRPSFIKAAKPDHAIPLYEHFIKTLGDLLQKPIATGTFGADMKIELVNDGPVTIIMDTKNKE